MRSSPLPDSAFGDFDDQSGCRHFRYLTAGEYHKWEGAPDNLDELRFTGHILCRKDPPPLPALCSKRWSPAIAALPVKTAVSSRICGQPTALGPSYRTQSTREPCFFSGQKGSATSNLNETKHDCQNRKSPGTPTSFAD